MAVKIELKRSAVPGKVPTVDQLDLGELAINTYDGTVYLKQDTTVSQSIIQLATTAGSGSAVISASHANYADDAGHAAIADYATAAGTAISSSYSLSGSFTQTASFAIFAATASSVLTSSYSISSSYAQTASYALTAETAYTASSADNFIVRQNLTASNALIYGDITAQTLHVQIITSSTEYITGSLIVDGGITGSLLGTASYATQALSSSYSETASYVNPLNQDVIITGSVIFDGGAQILPNFQGYSGSIDLIAAAGGWAELQSFGGDQYVWVDDNGAYIGTNYLATPYAWTFDKSGSLSTPGDIIIPASSFLQGTSSWAISASHAPTALTSSYAVSASHADNSDQAISSSYSLSGSYAVTASFALNVPVTSSYAVSASHANNADFAVTASFTTQTQFTGSFSGSFTGSISNLQGIPSFIPYFTSSQVLVTSSIWQAPDRPYVAINQTNVDSQAPEALYVWQASTSSYNVISGKGNLNNYLQLNIQNLNAGTSASSDVVATANNGSESDLYIDMGINGENFVDNGNSVGGPNDAYLYSTGNNLHIGNASSNGSHLGFFVGGFNTDTYKVLQLNPNLKHSLTGSLNATQGFTGSLYGTASWAISASYAPTSLTASYAISSSHAVSASYAISSSYAVSASSTVSSSYSLSGSYALTASVAVSSSYATTASYVQNAVSASYAQTSSYSFTASSVLPLYQDLFVTGAYSGWFNANVSQFPAGGLNANLGFAALYSFDGYGGPVPNGPDNSWNVSVIQAGFAGRGLQIAGGYDTSNIYFRKGNGTWQSWSRILNASVDIYAANMNQYVTTTSQVTFGGVTSSLFGSASYALTASYALNVPDTASFAISSSYAISASYATSSSYAISSSNALSSSYAISSSNAITSSYAISSSNSVSSSYSITASNALLLNGTSSLSFATTSSNYFSGSQILSGSLRFDPTTDPGIYPTSSTYLFQSASNTALGDDLYFRQDGNIVKWKWMEGQLGSGLLYGGGLSYSGSTIYVASGSGIIVNYNANTGSEISPIITYVNWGPITQSALYITSSLATYVYIDNAGTLHQQTQFFTPDQYAGSIPLGMFNHTGRNVITSVADDVYTVYGLQNQTFDFIQAFGPLKLSGLAVGGQSGSLAINVGSGTSYILGGFYQQQPENPSHKDTPTVPTASIARVYRSGSTFEVNNNGGAFFTTIDPTKWDDGSGTLQNVPGGSYTIQRVFFNPFTTRCHVYYGQSTYATLQSAEAGLATDSFVEAPYSTHQYVFAAYLIVKSNLTTLTDTANSNITQAGLFRNTVGSGGSSPSVLTLDDLSDVVINSPTNGQALIYNGGVWVNGIPTNASTASYVALANSASYALTASYVLNNATSSFALSASYASTASYVNPLNQNVQITGSLNTSANIQANKFVFTDGVINESTTGQKMLAAGGNYLYLYTGTNGLYINNQANSANNVIISDAGNLQTRGTITAGAPGNDQNIYFGGTNAGLYWSTSGTAIRYSIGSLIFSTVGAGDTMTLQNGGGLYVIGGITGSLLGNASTSTTASYALTASYAMNVPSTSSFAVSASYAVTSSYSLQSLSASLAQLAISSSFATTASFALNGGGGGVSAIYIADEGTLQGTASYFDFVGAGVTATVTAGTASINITGGGGGTAIQGASQVFTQSVLANTWSFAHNINSQTPVVEVYDLAYNTLIPTRIYNPGPFATNIYFDVAQDGYAIISTGGVLAVTGSNAILNQTLAATTWSFTHDLHTQYPIFTIYDSNNDVIIPQRINVVSTSSADIYFSSPRTGKAVASLGGNISFVSQSISASYADFALSSSYSLTASYVENATSSSYSLSGSYAETASYALNVPATASNATTASYALTASSATVFNIGGSQQHYYSVASSFVGSNNLFTQPTGAFTSGFYKYTISSGSNARSGEVWAVWNGGNVQYTDNSTVDIGSTTAVTMSVSIISSQAQFNAQTNTSNWNIKSQVMYM